MFTHRRILGLAASMLLAALAGPNPASAQAKAARVALTPVWHVELNDLPSRVAVGNVTGDGKPRLVTLNEAPGNKDAGVLTVKKWDGKAFVSEFSAPVDGPPTRLAVGKFAGPKQPDQIVTSDGLWTWNGTKFEKLPAPKPLTILGSTTMKSGEERVLISNSPLNVLAYRVDPKAGAGAWLTDAIKAPGPGEIVWGDMHEKPEFFAAMQLPPELIQGGIIGLWDVLKSGKIYIYYAHIFQELDSHVDPNGGNNAKVTVKSQDSFLSVRDPESLETPLWASTKFDGKLLDIGRNDPQGSGKPGLMVLADPAVEGKPRSLYFFALKQ